MEKKRGGQEERNRRRGEELEERIKGGRSKESGWKRKGEQWLGMGIEEIRDGRRNENRWKGKVEWSSDERKG